MRYLHSTRVSGRGPRVGDNFCLDRSFRGRRSLADPVVPDRVVYRGAGAGRESASEGGEAKPPRWPVAEQADIDRRALEGPAPGQANEYAQYGPVPALELLGQDGAIAE